MKEERPLRDSKTRGNYSHQESHLPFCLMTSSQEVERDCRVLEALSLPRTRTNWVRKRGCQRLQLHLEVKMHCNRWTNRIRTSSSRFNPILTQTLSHTHPQPILFLPNGTHPHSPSSPTTHFLSFHRETSSFKPAHTHLHSTHAHLSTVHCTAYIQSTVFSFLCRCPTSQSRLTFTILVNFLKKK